MVILLCLIFFPGIVMASILSIGETVKDIIFDLTKNKPATPRIEKTVYPSLLHWQIKRKP